MIINCIQSLHHFRDSFPYRAAVCARCCAATFSFLKVLSKCLINKTYFICGLWRGRTFGNAFRSWCNMRVRKKEENTNKHTEQQDYSAPCCGWRKIPQWTGHCWQQQAALLCACCLWAGWIIEIPMVCWQLWTFQRAQWAELVSAEVRTHFSPPFHSVSCILALDLTACSQAWGMWCLDVHHPSPKHEVVPRFTGRYLAVKEAGAILAGIFCLLCPV